MRDLIVSSLASQIAKDIAEELVDTFSTIVSAYRKGDVETCLTATGRFVDHTLRAIEYLRTGNCPSEIKSVAQTVTDIRKDTRLKDELRFLIPGVAAAIYDVRSKRGVVHVKEIDPRNIDAALCVSNVSWIISELIRLYHSADEATISAAMQSLMRAQVPLMEQIGPDKVVTSVVSRETEVLLNLRDAGQNGLDRTELGQRARCSPSDVTKAVHSLSQIKKRLILKGSDGRYRITGPGELHLADVLDKRERSTAKRPKSARKK